MKEAECWKSNNMIIIGIILIQHNYYNLQARLNGTHSIYVIKNMGTVFCKSL